MALKIEIIYDDDYFIVVNKPSGMLSIPDRHNADKPNVLTQLQRKYSEVFVVHRLDKETSGILIFARDAQTHAKLNNAFLNREVVKTYLAVVSGVVEKEYDTIVTGLAPDPQFSGKMQVIRTGKKSITSYKVKERFKSATLLEIDILTGRMHQIRVHCRYIGHPCLVDKLYGKNNSFSIQDIKLRHFNKSGQQEENETALIARTTLHSSQLTLKHPQTGETVTFVAPLPKDMKALLNQLRKWNSVK